VVAEARSASEKKFRVRPPKAPLMVSGGMSARSNGTRVAPAPCGPSSEAVSPAKVALALAADEGEVVAGEGCAGCCSAGAVVSAGAAAATAAEDDGGIGGVSWPLDGAGEAGEPADGSGAALEAEAARVARDDSATALDADADAVEASCRSVAEVGAKRGSRDASAAALDADAAEASCRSVAEVEAKRGSRDASVAALDARPGA
jgi:hypothetical protein